MPQPTTSAQKTGVTPPLQQQPYQIVVQPAQPIVIQPPPLDSGHSQLFSVLALSVSLLTLFRNLSQKRGEHRASFYHATVIDNALTDIIAFHRDVRESVETELPKLRADQNISEIRRVMAEIRVRTSKVQTKTSGLVRLFDNELEAKIQKAFDSVQDQITRFLAAAIDDQVPRPVEQLSTIVADSQAEIIALLRDGEFQQGWPSLAIRW